MSDGAGSYAVMPRAHFTGGDLQFRAIEPEDIEPVRQWRNAQMDVLRQTAPISPEGQKSYFSTRVWPEKSKNEPAQILLAIERRGELIGYCGFVHISWPNRRAELSFLLVPDLQRDLKLSSRYFEEFLKLAKTIAFDDLGLARLTTETFATRDGVIASLERCGFRREGRLVHHVVVDGRRVDSLVHGCNAPLSGSDKQNVLVSSASRKAPLLRAVRDALSRIDPEARVIAGDTDATALAQYVADDFWLMPRTEQAHLDALVDGCQARGIGAVLPTRDGELLFWARNRTAFAEAGIEIIVSPPEATERCLDKLKFAQFGTSEGLPVIPALETIDRSDEGSFVVKERFGAGARHIGLDLSADAALAHAATLETPIFQPYMTGPEISIDGWLDRRGKAAGVVLRRRDRVIDGESQVTTTMRDPDLEQEAGSILERLDLRGPVVMQAILSPDGMRIIEVNPRFGGASTLAIAAGLDTLYWSLKEVFGDPAWPDYRPMEQRLRQVRLPADIIIHDPDL